MATVWYFWHSFIHRDTTFMYLQYSHPSHLSPFAKCLEGVVHHQCVLFVDVSYWPCYRTDKFILSCTVLGPSQWFFHVGEVIVIAWTHIGWVRWTFQNLPLPATQEVRDSSNSMAPCIAMKNDGVLYHQVSSFAPERWTKVMMKEHAVVGSVYRLPWRYCLLQYYPNNVIRHNKHHLRSIFCRAHFISTRRTGMVLFIRLGFKVWFVWASPGLVHSDYSSKKIVTFRLLPVQKGLCDCTSVPLLHLQNYMGYPTQNIRRNMENSFVTNSDFCW